MESTGEKKRILLVEDDEFIRDLYKRQFTLANLSVDAVRNGKEALAILETNSYDLILLDIMLPDTNGLDVLKSIKGNERIKSIPVVLLTNLGQDTVIQEGFVLGAEDYIIKASHTPDQLIEKIRGLFERFENSP